MWFEFLINNYLKQFKLGVILLYVRVTSNSVSEMCLIYFGPESEVKEFL